jgi:hypothetical protein
MTNGDKSRESEQDEHPLCLPQNSFEEAEILMTDTLTLGRLEKGKTHV